MYQLVSSIAFLCLLALPVAAQEEALYGTWEGTFVESELAEGTMRLTFEADGTFALARTVEQAGEGEALFERLSVQFAGTYRVAGDSLWIDIAELYYVIDDTPMNAAEFGEFVKESYVVLARGLARLAADLQEISDESYPAFEQAFVDQILAEFDVDAFLAEFDLGAIEELNGTYAIEGDTLFITAAQGDGVEILEFHRIGVASAIVQATWGDLKAAWRSSR